MQITDIEMHHQTRTAFSRLIVCLTKLKFFTKPGFIVWSLFISAVEAIYAVQVYELFTVYNLSMKIVVAINGMSQIGLYVLCPLAIFLVGSSSTELLNSLDIRYPQYWYLLLLGTISECIHVVGTIYSYHATFGQILVMLVSIFNLVISLLLALVIGCTTSTLVHKFDKLSTHQEDDFVEYGKKLLKDFKCSKKGCQMGLFIVIVFKTTMFLLTVSL